MACLHDFPWRRLWIPGENHYEMDFNYRKLGCNSQNNVICSVSTRFVQNRGAHQNSDLHGEDDQPWESQLSSYGMVAGQFLMINGQQIGEQTVSLQGTAADSLWFTEFTDHQRIGWIGQPAGNHGFKHHFSEMFVFDIARPSSRHSA